jgi:hypothetical protein
MPESQHLKIYLDKYINAVVDVTMRFQHAVSQFSQLH